MSYPNIYKQIADFGLYILYCGKLARYWGEDTFGCEIHHFIKEQEYYRYPERYEGMQKLILLPRDIHKDLHSAMSDERFFEKYHVDRDVLLYRRRKADCGFWDKNGNYKEEIVELKAGEK